MTMDMDMYIYIHIHTCLHTCMHTCMHTYTHTIILKHTCIHTYIHTCIHAYVAHVYTYIYTCVSVYIYANIYTYMWRGQPWLVLYNRANKEYIYIYIYAWWLLCQKVEAVHLAGLLHFSVNIYLNQASNNIDKIYWCGPVDSSMPAEGPGGAKLGWGYIRLLDKAPNTMQKPNILAPKPTC